MVNVCKLIYLLMETRSHVVQDFFFFFFFGEKTKATITTSVTFYIPPFSRLILL